MVAVSQNMYIKEVDVAQNQLSETVNGRDRAGQSCAGVV